MLRKLIKKLMPSAVLSPLLRARARKRFPLLKETPEKIFTEIYNSNAWQGTESVSGYGSDLANTENIRRAFPNIIKEFGIKSMLDAPCGDFNWMKHVDIGDTRYVGGDIVTPLVERNRTQFSNERREFLRLDITTDALPLVDLIFCRDCFFHLSFADISKALKNFERSGAKFLMTTTLFTDVPNLDIPTGAFRPLSLRTPPFRFPNPLQTVPENEPDKYMGVWRLSDLPLSQLRHGR